MRRKIFSTSFAVALGLVMVGCGKDSGDNAGTPPAPAPKPAAKAEVGAAATAVTAPPPTAPVAPPPGNAAAAVAPAAPAAPSDNDILGGNGRELTEQEKIVLNYGIDMFKNEKGRYPKDLAEAVASKHIARIPKMPAGEELNYDPATGRVTVVKK